MEIQVLFIERNELTYAIEGYDHVANVDAPEHYDAERAMEYAFRRLQNIDGAWSMGPNVDYCDNPDYDPNVIVLKPLPRYNGRNWGHRSVSVGDRMIVDGDIYEVDSFGFKKVA